MPEKSQHPESSPASDAGGPEADARSGGVPAVATSDGNRVVVVTPDGMGVSDVRAVDDEASVKASSGDASGGEGERDSGNPADLVEQPAKVMRIGAMVKQLLEEVRNAPLDDKGRAHLADIHERAVAELKEGLAPELVAELERVALPFRDEAPSDAELRIAQAQLVGWLEGLFHGIQTALVAQQMAAQAQLHQMRALPPGHGDAQPNQHLPGAIPLPESALGNQGRGTEGTGQYL